MLKGVHYPVYLPCSYSLFVISLSGETEGNINSEKESVTRRHKLSTIVCVVSIIKGALSRNFRKT